MVRKLVAVALFVAAGSLTLSVDAADEAPAPRPADEKKADGPGGKFGKFGGGFGGKFDPEKFKEMFKGKGGFGKGGFDPEKLKEKFKDLDPKKLEELKEKFKGKGKGGFDPEKFKGKFKKDEE